MTHSSRVGLIVVGAIVVLAVLVAGALFCVNGLVVASYRPKCVRAPAGTVDDMRFPSSHGGSSSYENRAK